MSLMSEYYTVRFTLEDELWAKNLAAKIQKRQSFSYNNFKDKNARTRWIGILGEETVRRFFLSVQWKYHWKYYGGEKENGNDIDFTYNSLNIDIKTQNTKTIKPDGSEFIPTERYWLGIIEEQYQKMLDNKIINTIGFCVYNLNTKKCHFVGLTNIHSKFVFQPKGTKMSNYELYEDQRAIMIGSVIPPIEIDRL